MLKREFCINWHNYFLLLDLGYDKRRPDGLTKQK